MPTYEYECQYCGVYDVWQRMKDEPLRRCQFCGERVKRLISGGAGIAISNVDFVTSEFGGKEVRITSRKQEKKLMRKYGLVHYDNNSKAKNRLTRKKSTDPKVRPRSYSKKKFDRLREPAVGTKPHKY